MRRSFKFCFHNKEEFLSYQIYKIIHFIGIALVLMSLAGMLASPKLSPAFGRRFLSINHGIGLFLVLLGGFGLMARTGIAGGSWPQWIWFKFAIWLCFGAYIVVARRLQSRAPLVWTGMLVLLIAAATIANYKPL